MQKKKNVTKLALHLFIMAMFIFIFNGKAVISFAKTIENKTDYIITYPDGSSVKSTTVSNYSIAETCVNSFTWKSNMKVKAESTNGSEIVWLGIYYRADGQRNTGGNLTPETIGEDDKLIIYKGEDARKEIELSEDGMYHLYAVNKDTYDNFSGGYPGDYSSVEEYEEMLARYTINGTIDSSRCFISLDKKGPQISVIDVFDGTVYTNLNGKILTKDAALKVDSICDSPYGGIDSQRVFMTYTSPDGKKYKNSMRHWRWEGLYMGYYYLTAPCCQNGTYEIEYTDSFGRNAKEVFKLQKPGPSISGIINGMWYDYNFGIDNSNVKSIPYSCENATKVTLTVFKRGDYSKQYGEMVVDYTLDLPKSGILKQQNHGFGVFLLTAEDASGKSTSVAFRWGDSYPDFYNEKADKVTVESTDKSEDTTDKNTEKKKQTVKVKVTNKTLKSGKKGTKIKNAIKVTGAKGKVTYKIVSAKPNKKSYTINKKGMITLKKKIKKGTYKIKVKVSVAGNNQYEPFAKTVTLKVKVKK